MIVITYIKNRTKLVSHLSQIESKETQKHFNHWYAIKNINKLLPLFSVKFKVDTAEMVQLYNIVEMYQRMSGALR